jgi:murein DD-endopeptidase MepM/ murein hydrolase activator NlpD
MKLKLTEKQVEGLVKLLTEQEVKPLLNQNSSQPNSIATDKLLDYLYGIGGASIEGIKQLTSTMPTDPLPPDGSDLMHPLGHKSKITSNFGPREGSAGSSDHKGVDIATISGSPVYAPADGKVTEARDTTPNGCGGFIELEHSNYKTKFCHLRLWIVRKGDKVKQGQIIAYTGGGPDDPYRGTSTGPHLHYEILNTSDVALNPTKVEPNLV